MVSYDSYFNKFYITTVKQNILNTSTSTLYVNFGFGTRQIVLVYN